MQGLYLDNSNSANTSLVTTLDVLTGSEKKLALRNYACLLAEVSHKSSVGAE
jgi:hypothetical protein